MANFICGGDKYRVSGPNLDTIGLTVVLPPLPPTLEVEGYTLQVKSAFHVTLFAAQKIEIRNHITDPTFSQKIVGEFCKFVAQSPIELVKYRDEYRFVTQNERRSVVVMCDVSNLDAFYDLINKAHNLKLECPPTHVTLYTLQPDLGIFLTQTDEINMLSKIIPAPVKF